MAGTPPKGSGFTNTSKFLQANKNNQLGNTLASRLKDRSKAFTNDVNTASNQFQQTVSGYNPQAELDRAQGVVNNISTGYNPNEQDVSAFSNLLKGEYTGAKSLSDETSKNLDSKAQQLGNFSSAIRGGNSGQVVRALGDVGTNYTRGKEKLDQLLAGRSNELNKAASGAQNATQTLAKQRALTTMMGQQKAQGYKQAGDALRGTLNTGMGSIRGAIDSQTNQLNTQAQALADRLKAVAGQEYNFASDPTRRVASMDPLTGAGAPTYPTTTQNLTTLADAGLSASDLQLLGLDPTMLSSDKLYSAQDLQGLAGGLQPGFQATDAQRAQLQALNRLAGRPDMDAQLADNAAAFKDINLTDTGMTKSATERLTAPQAMDTYNSRLNSAGSEQGAAEQRIYEDAKRQAVERAYAQQLSMSNGMAGGPDGNMGLAKAVLAKNPALYNDLASRIKVTANPGLTNISTKNPAMLPPQVVSTILAMLASRGRR